MNNQKIPIKKFGGTSLGSVEKIQKVAQMIAKNISNTKILPVIVVSAMSGETNRLNQLAQQITTDHKGIGYDMLLASGEQVSVALLTLALKKQNIKATPLLAHQVGITTDSMFSKARIQNINTDAIKECLKNKSVPLVAGFQGITKQNNITTLGRGGSDTTAVALAVALKQDQCEIFTDVPHVYTADPNFIKTASKILKLSFHEMMEMSALGSHILHCRSVELAAKYKIKLHIKSTFTDTQGTWIIPSEEIMEKPLVSALTHNTKTAIIKMYPIPNGTQFISDLFNILATQHISVDIISQSYHKEGQRLAFSINTEDIQETKKYIYKMIDPKKVTILENLAKLSIIGVGMAHHPGVAARFFKALNSYKKELHLHLITTSEIKISVIIDNIDLSTIAQIVHKEFKLHQQEL